VPPVWVVPAFDETEYGVACLDLRTKAPSVKQLALESREKALGHRVVVLRREGAAAETDPLPGYSFRLALSSDRKSYRVSMQEKTPGLCRYDMSTDETGIVTEVSVGGPACQ
jgi:hypothetical protein